MDKAILVFLMALILFSCSDNENSLEERQRLIEEERNERLEYIRIHNIPDDAKKDEGLYYIELKEGGGDPPSSGDRLVIYFTIYNLDGRIISSNELNGRYEPLIVELFFNNTNNSALGYEISGGSRSRAILIGQAHALKYMKKGTRSRAIIPSNLLNVGSSVYTANFFTRIYEQEVVEIRRQ